jgi:hypothetical protein
MNQFRIRSPFAITTDRGDHFAAGAIVTLTAKEQRDHRHKIDPVEQPQAEPKRPAQPKPVAKKVRR